MSPTTERRSTRRDARGQALVEFAFAVVIFIGLLMGVLDLGRAVFMNNGVAEAAREIARVTSVHPGTPLGSSAQTTAVVDGQQSVIPSLDDPTFSCVDITGAAVSGACLPGNWVRVDIEAHFTPATPIFGLVELTLSSSSSIQIP